MIEHEVFLPSTDHNSGIYAKNKSEAIDSRKTLDSEFKWKNWKRRNLLGSTVLKFSSTFKLFINSIKIRRKLENVSEEVSAEDPVYQTKC